MTFNTYCYASFKAFKAVMFQAEVFCFATPCSFRGPSCLTLQDGGSMDLWNAGILPQYYTASQPRTPRLETLH